MEFQNKILKKLFLLSLFAVSSVQARWFWHEPAPVVVYREPSVGDAILTGVIGVGTCLGLGIASLVKHSKKKRELREYVHIFKDMGYSSAQAKIYANMAMEHPEGVKSVIDSINYDKKNQTEMLQQKNILKQTHTQKIQEMSHETTLKLMTYLVMMLSLVILAGLGFALYRRKK